MLNKPDTKKEKTKRSQSVMNRRRKFRRDVLKLDGRCMNPECDFGYLLEPHHIIYRDINQPQLDQTWNGITLCCHCHKWVHRSRKYMITILISLKGSPNFRWQKVLDILVQKYGGIR